jgi:hypothetical protein
VFGHSNLIVQQVRGDSQCLNGVLNSYRNKCLYIIKLFDTFSIKYIPREENSQTNQLAQQALGYVVSQRVFWVALVSLVEIRYALRSKGKSILEDSDRLRGNEKPILGNIDQLSGKQNYCQEEQSQNRGKQSRAQVRRNRSWVMQISYRVMQTSYREK